MSNNMYDEDSFLPSFLCCFKKWYYIYVRYHTEVPGLKWRANKERHRTQTSTQSFGLIHRNVRLRRSETNGVLSRSSIQLKNQDQFLSVHKTQLILVKKNTCLYYSIRAFSEMCYIFRTLINFSFIFMLRILLLFEREGRDTILKCHKVCSLIYKCKYLRIYLNVRRRLKQISFLLALFHSLLLFILFLDLLFVLFLVFCLLADIFFSFLSIIRM